MSNAITVAGRQDVQQVRKTQLSPLAKRSIEPMPKWVLAIFRKTGKDVTGNTISTYVETMPTAEQRAALETSRGQLAAQLEQTPENNPELEQIMLAAIAELMLSKPYRADDGELRREATVRSFQYALEDVPIWAILRAVKNWHRGKCDPYQNPKIKYNYRWMPDPTDLRKIAEEYVAEVRDRIEAYDNILHAVPYEFWLKGMRRPRPLCMPVTNDEGGFQTISEITTRVLGKSKAKANA